MKPLLLVVVLLGLGVAPLLGATGLGAQRQDFKLVGHACFVGKPAIAAPGKPWVWRTSFPDYHAEVDTELLRNSWHVAYIDCADMLGCDAALEGVSRGGLHAYRYAARHPQRIACIYADTPVLDLKSWPKPGGKEFADALKFYGLKDAAALRAFRGNPLDLLATIAQAKIPLRHVISMNDTIVPPAMGITSRCQKCLRRRSSSCGTAMCCLRRVPRRRRRTRRLWALVPNQRVFSCALGWGAFARLSAPCVPAGTRCAGPRAGGFTIR